MKYRHILLTIVATLALTGASAQRPRLVVNIVVSSMQASDLERYAPNFTRNGFVRLTSGGTLFTESYYDYQQTTTPTSLATLTTGAMPSTHGVVSSKWYDYVTNRAVELIDDDKAANLEYSAGKIGYSAENLIAPTITETLRTYLPDSRTVTVAIDPTSAIVMNGAGGFVFWVDPASCQWSTSTAFSLILPEWVSRRNKLAVDESYMFDTWNSSVASDKYVNSRSFDIEMFANSKKSSKRSRVIPLTNNYTKLCYTPAGNTATLKFAEDAVANLSLGADAVTDILNICLDSPRKIAEAYGPESVEMEDMYYRLDRDLSDFLTYIFAQVKDGSVVVMLTSDHGTSPSFDASTKERDRFNSRQTEVIVNSFLSARHGQDKWVLEYENGSIYLNHNLVYSKSLDLETMQNDVATFMMQFRGVSHALSATAMRTSYFGSGYAKKIQNSFYPRRSGDVVINLMPSWIEMADNVRSASGSMYDYDTHVPLIFYGAGIKAQSVDRTIDMTSVAPTLARIMKIGKPIASEGETLKEITK